MHRTHSPIPGLLDRQPRVPLALCPLLQDSETYVRNKKKACDEVGISSYGADLPETATEAEARL